MGDTLRSKQYMNFVRHQACLITGSDVDIVAHHVRIGFYGTGIKPSDYRCLPLTAKEHGILHDMGESAYWDERGIDPFDQIMRLNWIWLTRILRKAGKPFRYLDEISTAIHAIEMDDVHP